jgi:hypothetical protein
MPRVASFSFVNDVPTEGGLYALYGGSGRSQRVAYVGISRSSLRQRIRQHFVRQDSSIVTGTSAVSLNPNLVTRVEWWVHERFDDVNTLRAAEIVAFDQLNPVLRSSGRPHGDATEIAEAPDFRSWMIDVLASPTGCASVRSLSNAWEKIDALEQRIRALEVESR